MWCLCASRRKGSLTEETMKDKNLHLDTKEEIPKKAICAEIPCLPDSSTKAKNESNKHVLRIETDDSAESSNFPSQSPRYSRENSVKLKICRSKQQSQEQADRNSQLDLDEDDCFFFARNRGSFRNPKSHNTLFPLGTRASSFRHTTKLGTNPRSFDPNSSSGMNLKNDRNAGYVNTRSVPFRRGSMIVRSPRTYHNESNVLPKTSEHGTPSGECRFTAENFIFTPFAQILASLRKVRLMFMKLTAITSKSP
ncbi:hypothetical protein Ciccas_006485 [Cichlidogyrus casuarinus]|uniref:Uncharacterized protein n=1 Tax=Cichlidogyrus casuarinus TaxID=1844966 RepID=A0ABD2Q6N0_9PLAT